MEGVGEFADRRSAGTTPSIRTSRPCASDAPLASPHLQHVHVGHRAATAVGGRVRGLEPLLEDVHLHVALLDVVLLGTGETGHAADGTRTPTPASPPTLWAFAADAVRMRYLSCRPALRRPGAHAPAVRCHTYRARAGALYSARRARLRPQPVHAAPVTRTGIPASPAATRARRQQPATLAPDPAEVAGSLRRTSWRAHRAVVRMLRDEQGFLGGRDVHGAKPTTGASPPAIRPATILTAGTGARRSTGRRCCSAPKLTMAWRSARSTSVRGTAGARRSSSRRALTLKFKR